MTAANRAGDDGLGSNSALGRRASDGDVKEAEWLPSDGDVKEAKWLPSDGDVKEARWLPSDGDHAVGAG